MAIDFPNTPSNNQVFFDSTSGNRYVYRSDYSAWLFTANTSSVYQVTSVTGVTWVIQSSNYTANSGDAIFANTQAGSFTITLPSSPSLSTTIYFADHAGTWAANTLNIGRNGLTIMGLSEDLICDINNQSLALVYNGVTWRVV